MGVDVHAVYYPKQEAIREVPVANLEAEEPLDEGRGATTRSGRISRLEEGDGDMTFLPDDLLKSIRTSRSRRRKVSTGKSKPRLERALVEDTSQHRDKLELEERQIERLKNIVPPGWAIEARLKSRSTPGMTGFLYCFRSPDRKFQCSSLSEVRTYLMEQMGQTEQNQMKKVTGRCADRCVSCQHGGTVIRCHKCPACWHLECLGNKAREIGDTFYCPNCIFCQQ